jgi:hypothetical protein
MGNMSFSTAPDLSHLGRIAGALAVDEGELKIHNLDGMIAQSDSRGHDPRDFKG